MVKVVINNLPTQDLEIMGLIPLADKGRPGGVAELGSDGKVLIEQLPSAEIPTLEELGGEPAGAETRAKSYTDQKVSAIVIPTPTLQSLGAEPAGAEARAKSYTDEKVSAIVIPTPTLQTLGGEPAGAEARAKSYTDQKVIPISDLLARISTLENALPKNFLHIWGNTLKTSNGKSWQILNNSAYEFGRAAQFTSQALGDYAEFEQILKNGDYQLTLCFNRTTAGGLVTIFLNNNQIGQVDFYSATTQNNQRYTCNFTVNASGLQTFKIQANNKNASSSGYQMQISNVQCRSTDLSLIQTIRINAGDTTDYTATDNNVWKADYGFTGGNGYNTETTLGENFTVAGTTNQRLYKTERSLEGGQTFTYDLYVGQTGIFTLKLLFCEAYYTAAGQRVGTIKLNGNNILTNFDILTETARRTALVRTFNNLSLAGNIQLSFTNALINGIELIRV